MRWRPSRISAAGSHGCSPGWSAPADGTVTAVTYEYGNCFLIVAGLLNSLVVLDAFDIAMGRK